MCPLGGEYKNLPQALGVTLKNALPFKVNTEHLQAGS
jgi:hypothetical protein